MNNEDDSAKIRDLSEDLKKKLKNLFLLILTRALGRTFRTEWKSSE